MRGGEGVHDEDVRERCIPRRQLIVVFGLAGEEAHVLQECPLARSYLDAVLPIP